MKSRIFLLCNKKSGAIEGKYTSPALIDDRSVHRDVGQIVVGVEASHPALSNFDDWHYTGGRLEKKLDEGKS